MKKPPKSSLTDKALTAMRDAVAKVVEDHRQRGKPMAVWRNGKAVWMLVDAASALNETSRAYRTKARAAKS
jgi:hypothetical protein